MPRNVTVTLANGMQHTYANAPDDITPDAVAARAQKEFGQAVTAIDGGRGKAAPAAAPAPNKAASVYSTYRTALAKRASVLGPEMQQRALEKFDTDPRMQKLRAAAGLAPVTTRQQEVQAVARRNVERRMAVKQKYQFNATPESLQNEEAMNAGITNFFGLGPRIAAGVDYVSDKFHGRPADYSRSLEQERAENQYSQSLAPGHAIAGAFIGGIPGGGAVAKGVGIGATKLASTGLPVVAKTGNFLQKLMTLQKGQKVANAVKVATTGAAGGATQALGEGSDVGEGAAFGAVAPLALGGTIKGTQALFKLTRQATRPFSSSVSKAIREVVKESPDAIAARHAQISAQVGENVPLVAALNDQDFKDVSERVLKRRASALTTAKEHTGKYLRNFMDRMLTHVNNAGKTGDAQITSLGELAQLRTDTADEIMRPVAQQKVDLTQLPLDDLERQVTRQIGGRIVGLASKINQALGDLHPDDLAGMGVDASDVSKARKLMTDWGMGKPVHATVAEIDALRRTLDTAGKASEQSNPTNSLAYHNAAKTIGEFLSQETKGVYGKMLSTYAAQSRMMEGFETSAAGKRLTDIKENRLRNNLRTVEGRIGLKAGELFRQREAVTGRPTSAINAARDYAAQGKLTRPASLDPSAAQPGTITENIGEASAAQLANASQGETKVLGRMLDTEKVNALAQNEDNTFSPEEIAYGAFIGNALASTKARFLARLVDHLPHGFSEKVANNITDMLFSQDPALTQKAMQALNKIGLAEGVISNLMHGALPLSVAAGAAAGGNGALGGSLEPSMSIDANAAPSVEGDLGDTETPQEDMSEPGEEGDSPYTPQLQQIYDSESPELLDLIDRVEQQESGGDQSAVSPAGAVGVMQVMPDTAPEAAKLAGVRWDPQAYRTDANYNRLLGIAYLSEMLRRYDGDVEKALAAYNAGPGSLESAMAQYGDNWLAALPGETQDYVARIS